LKIEAAPMWGDLEAPNRPRGRRIDVNLQARALLDRGTSMDESFQSQRDRMVERQLVGRGLRDARVLRAMRMVPRERFVDARLAPHAHDDSPLPIAAGQTISQPFMVAWMVEAAELGPDDRVLEIGAGSGYASAVLAEVAGSVHAIERLAVLTAATRERLDGLGYRDIRLRTGDGTLGWPDAAPFDAILVAAAGPEVPAPLKAQLRIGGRLLMPLDVGGHGGQQLLKLVRRGESEFEQHALGGVSFVPLIGRYGWTDELAPATRA
jgi:protein-L-isoaspartate(D-aspartate) O-methyltransferase